jgi:hypothetical protein
MGSHATLALAAIIVVGMIGAVFATKWTRRR